MKQNHNKILNHLSDKDELLSIINSDKGRSSISLWVVITVIRQGINLAIRVSNYNDDDDGSAIREENRMKIDFKVLSSSTHYVIFHIFKLNNRTLCT